MVAEPRGGVDRGLQLRRGLVLLAGYAAVPLSLPVVLARLLRHRRVLRRADVVVVMSEGGFAHTITGPDIARRVFRGRRCVFVVLVTRQDYNRKVSLIWPDVQVLFVSPSLGSESKGRILLPPGAQWVREALSRVVCRLARQIMSRRGAVLTLPELYEGITARHEAARTMNGRPLNFRWPVAYFRLQEEVDAPPVRLPAGWRAAIRAALDRAASIAGAGSPKGRCCLYLRQKGGADITSARRAGSPLEEYEPAIRLLLDAGYQVLLTGDVNADPAMGREFRGMVVDAAALGVDAEAFNLYAATEADIVVGEAGGGIWLPGINRIPRLMVNAFPYFVAMPNSWICYKTVRDRDGKLVHYAKLFADHAYDYELEGMTVHNNTAREVRDAVAHFLETIAGKGGEDAGAEVLEALPQHAWLKHTNARLSPGWLKLFDAR